ncbi:MAG: cysteine--tRNA ligase [Bilophila sp.]
MQIYNTMTRKKEPFVPVRPGKVGVYACGITAYALSHIGHARSAVAFDVLVRLLRYKGYEVTFVRNFTDVDDKIINRANDEECSSEEIATTYIKAYHDDMDRLGVLRADVEPKATEHIAEMLTLCERLIADGHAYATPSGDVYFRVRSFPDYGKLSGRSPDDLRAGARVMPGEEKEDPLDFALWKTAKPGEPWWESPWGHGRPGWHIECSAMSEKHLPLPLDIHGGGLDLIFPHHENEIAQTEAALGKPLANVWMHNGFVQVNSEKMSKSLGNFKTIQDILESYLPETLRFFLVGKQYRSPIDFSFESMDESERGQKRVYECLREVDKALSRASWKPGTVPAELQAELTQLDAAFMDALDDDCNTAAALGHIFNLSRLAGRMLEDKKLRASEGGRDLLRAFRDITTKWDTIMGLFGQDPMVFLASLRTVRVRRRGMDMGRVESLLRERQEARAAKDFTRSDAARDELATLGVEVRDTPEGVVWDIL